MLRKKPGEKLSASFSSWWSRNTTTTTKDTLCEYNEKRQNEHKNHYSKWNEKENTNEKMNENKNYIYFFHIDSLMNIVQLLIGVHLNNAMNE